MKKLVLYYSAGGNTEAIANEFSKELNCDIQKIESKKVYPKKGIMSIIKGGKAILKKEEPELYPLNKNINDYDVLLIGTPIWVGTYAAPIKSFIKNYSFKNKKVILFCTHGGGGNGKYFENFKSELSENEYIGEIEFKNPLKDTDATYKKEIHDFLKKLELVKN